MPNNFIRDGDFTVASSVSDIRYIAPFKQFGINTIYVIEQDFVINRENFVPLAIDTAHPTLPDYFLAVETDPQPVSINDVVKWTRRWAKVPASFSRDGGTYPYTFPVLFTGVTETSRLFAKPLPVNSRILTEFFHAADSTTVPVIEALRYTITTSPNTDATSPYGEPVVANAGFGVTATIPNLAAYQQWIDNGTELVPEASRITANWMGYIHMRETIYIKAH